MRLVSRVLAAVVFVLCAMVFLATSRAAQPAAASVVRWYPLGRTDQVQPPVIRTRLAGSLDALMVFDTGASVTTISDTTVRKLGLQPRLPSRLGDPHFMLNGAAAEVMVLPTLELGQLSLPSVTCVVLPAGVLSSTAGFPIDGVLGANVIAGLSTRLDFFARKLVLSSSEHSLPPAAPGLRSRTIPLEWSHGRWFVIVKAGRAPAFRMQVDTGSDSTEVPEQLVHRLGLKAANPDGHSTARVSGDLHCNWAELPQISLGGMTVGGIRARWYPVPPAGFAPKLGMDVLGRYSVQFEPARSRMILQAPLDGAKSPIGRDLVAFPMVMDGTDPVAALPLDLGPAGVHLFGIAPGLQASMLDRHTLPSAAGVPPQNSSGQTVSMRTGASLVGSTPVPLHATLAEGEWRQTGFSALEGLAGRDLLSRLMLRCDFGAGIMYALPSAAKWPDGLSPRGWVVVPLRIEDGACTVRVRLSGHEIPMDVAFLSTMSTVTSPEAAAALAGAPSIRYTGSRQELVRASSLSVGGVEWKGPILLREPSSGTSGRDRLGVDFWRYFRVVLDLQHLALYLCPLPDDSRSTHSWTGIGVVTARDRNGQWTIGDLVTPSPAGDEGVQAGDRLLAVDGQSTEGISQEQIDRLLKPGANATVSLLLQHPREATPFEVRLASRQLL